MGRMTADRAVVLAFALAWIAACSDSSGPLERPGFAGLIVSQPISRPASAAGSIAASRSGSPTGSSIVYVSLVPGSVPTALQATIRDQTTGLFVITAVVDGGFDPVAITAGVGDTLLVEITRTGSAGPLRLADVVRPIRRPAVVRTSPPKGGRDVPLNATIVVVFSEPVDSATVTTGSIQLRRDTTPVGGRLEFRDPAHLAVAFVPTTSLAGTTTYTLAVTQGVADLSGQPLEAAVHVSFTTAAPAATPHLEFIGQPASTTVGTLIAAIQVAVRDSHGNTITTATDSITIGIGNNPNGGTLAGTSTVAAVSGVATFADLSLDKSTDPDPMGYTLIASATGFSSATSTSFRVLSSPVVRLAFDFPPPSGIAGLRLAHSVNVTPRDSLGNTVSGYTGTITLTIGRNPGTGVLSGITTSEPLYPWGAAEFQNVRIDQPGSGYTLVASAPGLPSTESAPFDVGPAIGAATRLIAFWTQAGELSVVDLDHGGVARLGNWGGEGNISWSPDGSKIAFPYLTGCCGLNYDIAVMNADGTGFTPLTNDPSDYFETPMWSPDGSRILTYGSRAGSSGLWIMNADGTGLAQLTSGPQNAGGVWSPDGARIAFASSRDGNYEIYVMNRDGSGVSRWTNDPADDSPLAWSPDGSKIAFESNRSGSWSYYLLNTDGSGVSPLPNELSSPKSCGCFNWSSDGTKLVIGLASPLNTNNYPADYVMNSDGSGLTKLNTGEVTILGPQWSPDGTTLYATGWVTAAGNNPAQVYTMNPDGSGLTALTPWVLDTNMVGGSRYGGASPSHGRAVWRPRP